MLRRTLGLVIVVPLACGVTTASRLDPNEVDPRMWIEVVRATNRDRVALDRESSLWRDERRRLTALRDAVTTEAVNLTASLDDIERRIDDAAREIATIERRVASVEDAHRALDDLARLVTTGLRDIERSMAPGCVVVPNAAGLEDDAAPSLGRALDALRRSEAAVDTVDLGVHTGFVGDREIAAHVLRVSGAAAWWIALDESRGGCVERDAATGRVVLREVNDPVTLTEIRAAVGIAAGTTSPRPCELPLVALRPETAR